MIPKFAIDQWNSLVPWTDRHKVEQDLLICRALVAIYSDEYLAHHLAFRGGTALHKLYLHPQPRYSEDIDLSRLKQGRSKRPTTVFAKFLPFWESRKSNRRSIIIL